MKKLISLLSISLCFFLLSACSRPPADEVIKKTITEYLKLKTIRDITQNSLAFGDIDITEILFLQKGKFNKQDKYWPLEVEVKGNYRVEPSPFSKEYSRAFDEVYSENPSLHMTVALRKKIEEKLRTKYSQVTQFALKVHFQIYLDDYGVWKARTKEDFEKSNILESLQKK